MKNILLFVPPIMAHRIAEPRLLLGTAVGFIAFGCCASASYLLNDMMDLDRDRAHPLKRFRPLPSGEVSLKTAAMLVLAFLAAGLALAFMVLPRGFFLLLVLHVLIAVSYSVYFKRILLVDVLLLAGLYTLRIVAGGQAVDVPVSPWLLAFSMFFFLSLAFAKRFSELYNLRSGNNAHATGRGYLATDLEQIGSLGGASGYISVLVLALYINGKEVVALYSRPYVLWLICPILLYWISRVWLLAHRGMLHEDPVIFAVKDKASYLVGVLTATLLVFAA